MESFGTIDDLLKWPHIAKKGLNLLNSLVRAYINHDSKSALLIDRNDVTYFVHTKESWKPNVLVVMRSLVGLKIRAFTTMSGPGIGDFALTENGALYGWAAKNHKQLGAEPGTNCRRTTRVTIIGDRKVASIACGSSHAMALTEDGEVWAWGSDVSDITDEQRPWKIPKCSGIAAGDGSSVALTEDGDVYVRGSNEYGQLGCQNRGASPYKVSLDRPVFRVAMGLHHVLALTDDGRVFAWGRNDHGQIGNNDQEGGNATSPEAVECKEGDTIVKLVDIIAIKNTSFAISTNGIVYVWGECCAIDKKRDRYRPKSTGMRNLNTVLALLGFGTRNTLVIRSSNFNHNVDLAFDDISLSDCNFLVEGKKIHAQKSLLKANSPYFKTMLDGAWKESTGEITITGYSYPVYKAMLGFLCTGRPLAAGTNSLQLLQLAHEIMCDNLVNICVEDLRFNLSVENISDVFAVAKALDLKTLLCSCKLFTNSYMRDIVEKEVGERPELMTQLLKFAAGK